MIVTVPNPVLTSPAKPVTSVDKKILQVINTMKRILVSARRPKGVGLAAVQIGIPLRIFVTRPTEKSQIRVFLNPEILEYSPNISEIQRPKSKKLSLKPSLKEDRKLEGCLSIPNVWGNLKRPESVKLRYMDIDGNPQEETFTGFMATIVQHETDHTNGILFTHRILEQKEKLFRIEVDDDDNEKLVEIEI